MAKFYLPPSKLKSGFHSTTV